MSLSNRKICSMARDMARTPGLTSWNNATTDSGDVLNYVLQDLCETFDFTVALGTAVIQISGAVGSGPYNLPADYLRMASNEVFYLISGTPRVMVNVELAEFDAMVQTAGISNFPEFFATNPALTPVGLFIWPPTGINTGITIRYYRRMPDIANAETDDANSPWFPNTNYLVTRMAGELMKLSDAAKSASVLMEAKDILTHFLKLQADDEGRATTVKLDRRRFGTKNFSRLPNTKTIGF